MLDGGTLRLTKGNAVDARLPVRLAGGPGHESA